MVSDEIAGKDEDCEKANDWNKCCQLNEHCHGRANNHDDYMEALDYYVSPAQNFAVASAGGDVAMRVQGTYPNKAFEEGKRFIPPLFKFAADNNAWRKRSDQGVQPRHLRFAGQ